MLLRNLKKPDLEPCTGALLAELLQKSWKGHKSKFKQSWKMRSTFPEASYQKQDPCDRLLLTDQVTNPDHSVTNRDYHKSPQMEIS